MNEEVVMAKEPDATAQSVQRVQRAQQLFREFYAICFWHWNTNLLVTKDNLPSIIHGLKVHGGKRGLQAAQALMSEDE